MQLIRLFKQRIKEKKYAYRKCIGKYPAVGINQALARAKQLSNKIYLNLY